MCNKNSSYCIVTIIRIVRVAIIVFPRVLTAERTSMSVIPCPAKTEVRVKTSKEIMSAGVSQTLLARTVNSGRVYHSVALTPAQGSSLVQLATGQSLCVYNAPLKVSIDSLLHFMHTHTCCRSFLIR